MTFSAKSALLVLAAGLFVAAAAYAGPDDRAAAESAVRELEASPKKAVAAEMTARAKTALDRGAKLRAAGDETHARLADTLARTWADAARESVRAAELEEKAFEARRDASDAGARADRERALLEEAIAQSGRLRAQLGALEHEAPPSRTSDAGAAKPKDGGAK